MIKKTIEYLKSSFFLLLFFSVIFGCFYPLIVYGIGSLFFHKQSEGSLIQTKEGEFKGSFLIGQSFESKKYFHTRPVSERPLGLSSKTMKEVLEKRVLDYRTVENLDSDVFIPVDAVTSSSSAQDPHISIKNAYLQIPRIAKERHMSKQLLLSMIYDCENKAFFHFSPICINVVKLNYLLDQKEIESKK